MGLDKFIDPSGIGLHGVTIFSSKHFSDSLFRPHNEEKPKKMVGFN